MHVANLTITVQVSVTDKASKTQAEALEKLLRKYNELSADVTCLKLKHVDGEEITIENEEIDDFFIEVDHIESCDDDK